MPAPTPSLGAGGVTYEPEDFVLKVAQQTNVDYVDIHLYLVKMKGEDQVAKLATLVRKVREARPNMKVTIGEAWLLKTKHKEGPKATIAGKFSVGTISVSGARWMKNSLNLLMGLAQKEKISVVPAVFQPVFFHLLYIRRCGGRQFAAVARQCSRFLGQGP